MVLDQVLNRLSYLYGNTPIVFFDTEDADFLDRVYLGDATIDQGGPGESKANTIKQGKGSNWIPLMATTVVCPEPEGSRAVGKPFERPATAALPRRCALRLNPELDNFGATKSSRSQAWYVQKHACQYLDPASKEYAQELVNALWCYIDRYQRLNEAERRKTCVFLSDAGVVIPTGMTPYISILQVPLADEEDIRGELNELFRLAATQNNPDFSAMLNGLVHSIKGNNDHQRSAIYSQVRLRLPLLEVTDANRLAARAAEVQKTIDDQLNHQKEQTVERSDHMLRYREPTAKNVVGCGEIEAWVQSIRLSFLYPDRFPGVKPPKGMLVAGVPGTGKTMMADRVANLLGVPILQLDMGSVQDRFVGESERKFRMVLKIAEATAPVVLFIDELEKAFSFNENSHEVTKRIFGNMLSWMQDNKKPIFLYATANDISALNSAFLRSGRFDRKYTLFMPCRDECRQIFQATLETRLKPNQISDEMKAILAGADAAGALNGVLDDVGRQGKFLTGADISTWINDALICYYNEYPNAAAVTERFVDSLRTTLKDLRPYGATNLHTLTQFWLQNCFNPYTPANANELLRPEDFSLPDGDHKEKDASYFKDRTFENEYDRQLYTVIRKRIDALSPEYIRNKYMLTNTNS